MIDEQYIKELLNKRNGRLTLSVGQNTHDEIDTFGKANNYTITYADWHPNPEYRIFRTGSLLSRNDKYPSGLILIDNKGKPRPYRILI